MPRLLAHSRIGRLAQSGAGANQPYYLALRTLVKTISTFGCSSAAAKVAEAALSTGVSGALMGLTTDVLIYKPRHNRDEDVDFEV